MLGSLGNKSAVPTLIERLNDQDNNVRSSVANALGSLGDKSVVPALIKKLNDQHDEVRYHVAKALGHLGDKSAVPALIEKLNDQNYYVRRSVAKALGFLGDKDAIPTLTKKLNDQDDEVRNSVSKIPLKTIAHTETDKTKLLALIENEDHPYPIRRQALSTLATTHKHKAIPDMLRLLKQDEETYGDKIWQLFDNMQAKQVQPLLEKKLQIINNRHKEFREYHETKYCGALDTLFGTECNNKIQEDYSIESAFQYAHALARIDSQRGIELLDSELAEIRQGAWRGLATLGDVELVKQMTKLRFKNRHKPLFHHALFRAIDLSLINIQVNAKQEDLDALTAWFPTLKRLEAEEKNGQSPITQRTDWTLGLLRYHLQVAMPELERRYKVWAAKQH